jgi:hypothetical protein
LLEVLRQTARRQGHSERTISAFVAWVTIFVRFHRQHHPRELQLADVGRFLEQVGKTARDPLTAMEEARLALEFFMATSSAGTLASCRGPAAATRTWPRAV